MKPRMKKAASRKPASPLLSHFILHPSGLRCLGPLILCLALAACGTMSTRETPSPVARAPDGTPAPVKPPTPKGGGYYLNDGPGDNPPPNLDQVPDAVPKLEPLARGAMRPYAVMGQSYTPMTQLAPYKARGIASWYGVRRGNRPRSFAETKVAPRWPEQLA